MSASLVGSEMCIRDRHLFRAGPPSSRGPLRKTVCRPGPARAARRPPVPVSYTHLTLPTICSV
eukprot:13315309-Alexandrium_andersonii.AAC.1